MATTQTPKDKKKEEQRLARILRAELTRRMPRSAVSDRAFRGGSAPGGSKKHRLYISKYLYSIMDPVALNVSAPSLGPMPFRPFQHKSVFVLSTAAAAPGKIFFTVDPAQLWPTTVNAIGGFLTVFHGTAVAPSDGASVIGTSQVNNSSGPYLMPTLYTKINSAFLNSAEVEVAYIGGTLADAGVLRYAIVPTYDANSSAPDPTFENLAELPLGDNCPITEGVSLPWLPSQWGTAERVLVNAQSNRSGVSSIPISNTNCALYFAADTGVADGKGVFLVTVYQNFSMFSTDVFFMGGAHLTASSASTLQHNVEHKAVTNMLASQGVTPIAHPVTQVKNGEITNKPRQFRKSRMRNLGKFLKKAWTTVQPALKLAWENRAGIGDYVSDFMTPAALPAGTPTALVTGIEEVEEGAQLAPLLLL